MGVAEAVAVSGDIIPCGIGGSAVVAPGAPGVDPLPNIAASLAIIEGLTAGACAVGGVPSSSWVPALFPTVSAFG
jgi:hypothetical protein